MLTITEAACSHLADLCEKHESSDVVVLRMVEAETGLALKGDKLRAGDKTFEYRGKPVLAVDQKLYLHHWVRGPWTWKGRERKCG